jgi:glutamine synthetase
MVLPAALKYQIDVAQAYNAAKEAGIEDGEQMALLQEVVAGVAALRKRIAALDAAAGGQPHESAVEHARYQRDVLLPAMSDLRAQADKLELTVADEYWPLPKYREMLFIH